MSAKIRNITPEELAKLQNKESEEVDVVAYKEDKANKKHNKGNNESIEYADVDIQELEEKGILKKRKSYFEPMPIKFKLPSGKKEIDEKFLTENNEIFVRRFSSKEEDIMARTQLEKNSPIKMSGLLNEALNMVIKTNISIEKLSLVDKMALLIFVFAITYGNNLDIADSMNSCKRCVPEKHKDYADEHGLTTNTVMVDLLKDMVIDYVPDDYEYPFNIKLDSYGGNISFSFVYPNIEKEETFMGSSAEVSTIMKSLVKDISGSKENGNPIKKEEWDDIINYLNKEDRMKIKKKIEEFGQFGLKNKCNNFKCSRGEECGLPSDIKEIDISVDLIMRKIAEKMNSND